MHIAGSSLRETPSAVTGSGRRGVSKRPPEWLGTSDEKEISDLSEKAGGLPLLSIMLARRFMLVEDVKAGLASEPQSDGDVRRNCSISRRRWSPSRRGAGCAAPSSCC